MTQRRALFALGLAFGLALAAALAYWLKSPAPGQEGPTVKPLR